MSATTRGISPKLVTAVVMAVLTYLLGQEVLELPPILVLLGQALLVGLGVYRASPGLVDPENPFVPDGTPDDDHAIGGE